MNAIFKAGVAIKPRAKDSGRCGRSASSRRRWLHGFEPVWMICVMLWAGTLAGADPVVSNIQVRHPPGTLDVEVTYDLAVDDPWQWRVILGVSTNRGVSFVEVSDRVQGNLWPVRSGPGQRVIWNPPASWLGLPATDLRLQLKVVGAGPRGMVPIRPGTFTMGSPASEVGRDSLTEGPLTEVTLSRGYWLGRYEVTQQEWFEVMGNNPSRFRRDGDLPVESITWEQAMEFCQQLTRRERKAGRVLAGYEYRLPTEAEWEYACRAGTKTATAFGDRLDSTKANFHGKSPYNSTTIGPNIGATRSGGGFLANIWGLYDMHGNVAEWCLDGGRLPGGAVTNLSWPGRDGDHVFRGGSWLSSGASCRSSAREFRAPSWFNHGLGFRVAYAPVLP